MRDIAGKSVVNTGLIVVCLLLIQHITGLTRLNSASTKIDAPSSHKEYISTNSDAVNSTATLHSDSSTGKYETLEGTIARIKRSVIVTGTITGVAGKESAVFQIEGMPDRIFDINTQLMDGFVIIEITKTHVVLKNQTGNETIVLNVK